ncbi:MAG: phosphoserine transaminase [Alphaproteobacteria bacterium]|nr:phosphoserine transaminase [Alphaproteobacteria bacterium]
MTVPHRPLNRPENPNFSSGPCRKRPGWTPSALDGALTGRSHRSAPGVERLRRVIEESRAILGLPADYRLAIMPASDTGAIEAALWSLLGTRGVEVLAWEAFGKGWAVDITGELKLTDVRLREAAFGELPDLAATDWSRDVVFTWNGTTSGVRVPDGNWIAGDRQGLSICDATSAVFAMELPWDKLDVVTWSWQKVLGGEAQHGMLALSPRAAERLKSYNPSWPLPKVFRMAKGGKLIDGLFRGETINTPSMLCVEDQLDALNWARDCGGLPALIRNSQKNLALIDAWVARSQWARFLATRPEIRSSTSVCLGFKDAVPADKTAELAKRMAALLEAEGVAYDIGAYRDAPPGLRIWAGATVPVAEIERLLPWLDWAFASTQTA